MFKFLFTGVALLCTAYSFAGNPDSLRAIRRSEASMIKKFRKQLDSTNRKIRYQQGQIPIAGGQAMIQIPKGYQFIDSAQTRFILEELWGNLPDASVQGMLVQETFRVNHADEEYTYVISYQPIGFVKDHDAHDTNYEELLFDMQQEQEAANFLRLQRGYNTMSIVGWAELPYYDKEKKILHWAREIAVSGSDINVLNYEVRLLGRSSVISFNAVATMDKLEKVKQELPKVLAIARFSDGQEYRDFNKQTDAIAELTVGTMVAGKTTTRVGVTDIRVTTWRIILMSLAAAGIIGWVMLAAKRKADSPHA